MKLFEYEAKQILAEHGIRIPRGAFAASPPEAKEAASGFSAPYVVKAQVLVSGRGKAGGIRFADTLEDVEGVAQTILGMKIKGLEVGSVWIEEKINVKAELYCSMTIDRSCRCYVAMGSTAGGMDIEDVATQTPEKITKIFIDPVVGFRSYHARRLAGAMGYSGNDRVALSTVLENLYKIAMEYDAELIEMNPLVEAVDGGFVAADARIVIDDNALFRHAHYRDRLLSEDKTELTAEEIKARKAGLAYVQLDGDIGIMGNGAGLVMATLDAVHLHGGKPANFLDVGGGASEDQIVAALDILLADLQASVVLINILGGITRCDYVAKGILGARQKLGFTKPMVIRLVGTNEELGRRLLTEAGIPVLDSMEEAARKAAEASRGG